MKIFLIRYETRDGENEYGGYFMLKAKDQEDAEKKAKIALRESIIGNGNWVDDVLDCFDTQHHVEDVEELIDPSEIKALAKRFTLISRF